MALYLTISCKYSKICMTISEINLKASIYWTRCQCEDYSYEIKQISMELFDTALANAVSKEPTAECDVSWGEW